MERHNLSDVFSHVNLRFAQIELLVLGGTWESYPMPYQTEFLRDLFYAANTFLDRAPRQRLDLAEEQRRNETASVKIIGLTLGAPLRSRRHAAGFVGVCGERMRQCTETRPDTIDAAALRRLREYGCTRVQLGLQHTDDAILKKINRGCTNSDASRAIRLLKDACFKVDIHLMPNLPGASPAADATMFDAVLEDPALQADQVWHCGTWGGPPSVPRACPPRSSWA
jgi:histone acetyltransferase (RNA polymerase elongator complex component)